METNLETQTASQSVDEVLNYTETVMKSTIVNAVKAQVDKDIKPLSDELSAGKTAMRNLLTSKGVTYKDTDSIAELAAKLSAACLTLGGCELAEGCEWSMDKMLESGYGNIIRVIKSNTCNEFPYLGGKTNTKCVWMPAVTYISTDKLGNNLLCLYCPNVTSMSTSRTYYDDYTIRHFNTRCGLVDVSYGLSIYSAYDVTIGTEEGEITSNVSFARWRATNALSATSQSLTPRDEWDTHPSTVTFLNNLEKFLWYFEHRFMPSFATIPSTAEKPTLTLSTAVYNAISASTAVAHNADGSTMYATADYSDFGTYDEAAGRTTAVTLLKALEKKQNWNVANA